MTMPNKLSTISAILKSVIRSFMHVSNVITTFLCVAWLDTAPQREVALPKVTMRPLTTYHFKKKTETSTVHTIRKPVSPKALSDNAVHYDVDTVPTCSATTTTGTHDNSFKVPELTSNSTDDVGELNVSISTVSSNPAEAGSSILQSPSSPPSSGANGLAERIMPVENSDLGSYSYCTYQRTIMCIYW